MELKSATNRILTWSRRTLGRRDSLAIAGVNTTLIAVLVACLSAYIVFAYSTVQQAELKAIEEAEKINNILFLVHQCAFRRLDQRELFDKEKLIDMMFTITNGADDPSLPKDVNGRAQKALGIMGALVGQYPFPALYFRTKEGRHGSRSEAEPVSFANLNEVRTWINAIKETTAPFGTEVMGITGCLWALLEEFSKSALVSERREKIMKSPFLRSMLSRKRVPGFGIGLTMDGLDPVLVHDDFLNRIVEAMSIVGSTQNYVKHADALRKGYPSKLRSYIIVFLIAVAFVCGVVYPLAAANVRRVFALWLPFLIYVLIGLLAFGIFR